MAIDFSNYISVLQFAKLCGCTRKTVYRMMKSKDVTWYSTAPDRAHYFEKDKSIAYAKQWRKSHAGKTPTRKNLDTQPPGKEPHD